MHNAGFRWKFCRRVRLLSQDRPLAFMNCYLRDYVYARKRDRWCEYVVWSDCEIECRKTVVEAELVDPARMTK